MGDQDVPQLEPPGAYVSHSDISRWLQDHPEINDEINSFVRTIDSDMLDFVIRLGPQPGDCPHCLLSERVESAHALAHLRDREFSYSLLWRAVYDYGYEHAAKYVLERADEQSLKHWLRTFLRRHARHEQLRLQEEANREDQS